MQARRELRRCQGHSQWRSWSSTFREEPGQLGSSGDRAAESLRHQQRDPQVFNKSAKSVRRLVEAGGKALKRIAGNSLGAHAGPRSMSVSPTRV